MRHYSTELTYSIYKIAQPSVGHGFKTNRALNAQHGERRMFNIQQCDFVTLRSGSFHHQADPIPIRQYTKNTRDNHAENAKDPCNRTQGRKDR